MCSYVLYYVHQKWTVYSLYIDCWEVPRPMRPQRQTRPAPERCWFLLWCICFTKLKTIQTVCSLASLDTEARNSQEDLAERSNISEYFYRRKPASLSVSSCQEATSTPCSTQTLDCASGSGTQRMLRHDCMVATCLPRGGFAKSVWAWCPGVYYTNMASVYNFTLTPLVDIPLFNPLMLHVAIRNHVGNVQLATIEIIGVFSTFPQVTTHLLRMFEVVPVILNS